MLMLDNLMFTHGRSGHLIVAATMDAAITLGLCEDAQKQYLWVVDKRTQLGRIDVKTGEVETIGKLGIGMEEIAFDQQGFLKGINGNDVYRINTRNASLSMVGGTDGFQDHDQPAAKVPRQSTPQYQDSNVLAFGQPKVSGNVPQQKPEENRSDSDLAFDLARLFMKIMPQGGQNMVQLAIIDGKSIDIGVFGYGTIYGRAKSQVNLFQMNDPAIYTTDSITGDTMAVSEHPRNRLRTAWNAAICTDTN